MSKKLGFALGAGGSRGVAHIGFLKAMEENGIYPDFISGTSMGSIVGACYALGMTPDAMAKVVTELKMSEILDLSLNPLGSGALLRSQKVQKKLRKYLGKKTFNDLKIPFECVATDLIAGKAVRLGGDKDVVTCITASSTIPSVFKPISMDNMLLVDGGVTCRVPITTVREMGADVVIGIDVLGKVRPNDRKYNMISLLFRMFEVCDCELVKYKVEKQNPDMFIEPDLGNMVQFKFKDIPWAIERGYETGKEFAPKIKELLSEK